MNPLVIDSATGFLTSDNDCAFDASSKLRVLEMARQCAAENKYPKISALCKSVGIYPQTFYNHLRDDPSFRREWETVIIEIEELLSESLVRNAQRANGVGAAAFWLKNRVPQRWSDNPGLSQQINDIGFVKKLADMFRSTAIEGEIVSKPEITSTPQTSVDKST